MIEVLHILNGWGLVAANGFVGFWALLSLRVNWLDTPWLWRSTAAAQALFVSQAITGTILYQRHGEHVNTVHMFYGFISVVAVAVLYSYSVRLGNIRRAVYGVAGLFFAGMALRAIFIDAVG